jgi:hypothetical protein
LRRTAPNTGAVKARIVVPIALLALAAPTPALADDGSGGTGVPAGANGGVPSIPGQPTTPPAPVTADAGPAPRPAVAPGVPERTQRQVAAPAAEAAKSGGGDVVNVPVPRSRRKAAPAPTSVAAPPASLPTTGFDLGVFAAAGLLMTGAGLLLSAAVGPRARRRAQARPPV